MCTVSPHPSAALIPVSEYQVSFRRIQSCLQCVRTIHSPTYVLPSSAYQMITLLSSSMSFQQRTFSSSKLFRVWVLYRHLKLFVKTEPLLVYSSTHLYWGIIKYYQFVEILLHFNCIKRVTLRLHTELLFWKGFIITSLSFDSI